MPKRKLVSLVIPVFNEQENLRRLWRELRDVTQKLPFQFEYVFIDDGSTDSSWKIIRELRKEDRGVRGFQFTRNFGHQSAISAGLMRAQGDWIITMDADLQHPPHIITHLLKKAVEGFEVVNTKRIDTKEIAWTKRQTSALFYWIFRKLSGLPMEVGSADFRLMSRKALQALQQYPEQDRFYRGLIHHIGFSSAVVEYVVRKRYAGKSKIGWQKMVRFALSGLTSFTVAPLRAALFFGIFTACLGFLYALFVAYEKIIQRVDYVPGWATVVIVILIMGGVQLILLGVLGEYLAAVIREVKARPEFLINEELGAQRTVAVQRKRILSKTH